MTARRADFLRVFATIAALAATFAVTGCDGDRPAEAPSPAPTAPATPDMTATPDTSSTSPTAATSAPQPAIVPAGSAAPVSGPYAPRIDPAAFGVTVDNPFFPLRPGMRWEYRSNTDDGVETTVVVVMKTYGQ